MYPHRQTRGLPAGAPLLLAVILILVSTGPAGAATLELTGPPGAVVSLGDRVLGAFPLDGPLELPPGNYVIRCSLPGHVPYEHRVRLSGRNDWQRVAVRPMPLSRRTAWSSNLLLAGLGQHYLGHSFRGYVYNLAEIAGLGAALAGEFQRSNLEKDYLELVERYGRAVDGDEVAHLGGLAETKYQDMKDQESLRNTGLMVAGSAIAVSIVDALLSFPAVASGTGPVPVRTGTLDSPWNDGRTDLALHAGLRLQF